MSVPGKYLLSRTVSSLDQFHMAAAQKRAETIDAFKQPGDTDRQAVERFRDQIKIDTINTPDHPDFDEVYSVYLKNFPIKSEQESKEGFNQVLGFNTDPDVQKKYGPFEETWVVARDPQTNKVIGGVNFITFHLGQDAEATKHVEGVQHLTYCFVSPEYRSMGVAGKLMNASEEHSRTFLMNQTPDCHDPAQVRMPSFNEQNQPMAMSLQEYFFDTMNAGIDQYDRLKYWNNRGFRRLEHDYVQPPLEAGEDPCLGLSLYAKTDPKAKSIPSSVLSAYLHRYFSSTVLKDNDANNDPYWIAQREALSEKTDIKLAQPSPSDNKKDAVWKHLQEQTKSRRPRYTQPLGEVDLPDTKPQTAPPPMAPQIRSRQNLAL